METENLNVRQSERHDDTTEGEEDAASHHHTIVIIPRTRTLTEAPAAAGAIRSHEPTL